MHSMANTRQHERPAHMSMNMAQVNECHVDKTTSMYLNSRNSRLTSQSALSGILLPPGQCLPSCHRSTDLTGTVGLQKFKFFRSTDLLFTDSIPGLYCREMSQVHQRVRPLGSSDPHLAGRTRGSRGGCGTGCSPSGDVPDWVQRLATKRIGRLVEPRWNPDQRLS